MKNIVFLIFFLGTSLNCFAQFFQATIQKEGNDLIFLLRPNPGGGDITTKWSDTEFFVRWPDSSPAFNFGTITVNTSDFSGISIPNNGQNAQGSETGYTNNWFGTSYTASSTSTYTDGVSYEIFRVTLDIPAANIDFELVHNEWFAPHYLALIDGNGNDLSNVGGNMFYSDNAMICSPNCPASTPGTNHADQGISPLLPVEMLRFTAKKLEKEVQLDWITASEENNRGFNVERKTAQQDWTEIGFEEGNRTTRDLSNYSFLDTNPEKGNNYYRLKQIDFDGKYEYSDIRVIHFENTEIIVSIFPNPASNVINIQFQENLSEGELQLFDQLGRSVLHQRISNEELLKTIPIHPFSEGVYTLLIFNNNQRFSEKIIIQKHN